MAKVRALRIKDWDMVFENHRTRELKWLGFIGMPNHHDSDGFTELMDHPEGEAHYGVWCLIVQVASRCHPRGLLIRSCHVAQVRGIGADTCAGTPRLVHDARTIAARVHGHQQVFETGIKRLLDIGWLEEVEMEEAEFKALIEEEKSRANLAEKSRKSRANLAPRARARTGRDRTVRTPYTPVQDVGVQCAGKLTSPPVEEVVEFAKGTTIPEDFARYYFEKCHARLRWFVNTPDGQCLINWQRELVIWWNKDRDTWKTPKEKHANHKQPHQHGVKSRSEGTANEGHISGYSAAVARQRLTGPV